MKVLLDTRVVLWWLGDPHHLSSSARDVIAGADVAFVSVASAWEVAVKASLGRLRLPGPFADAVRESGFSELGISFEHTAAAGQLPPIHSDPFDRLLVAQARTEGLLLVCADQRLAPYGVQLMSADAASEPYPRR